MDVNIHFYGYQAFWSNVLVIFTQGIEMYFNSSNVNIWTVNFTLAARSTPNA